MSNIQTSKVNRSHRILKVFVIALGSLVLIISILFLLRIALARYAYYAQGFPAPVSNYKPEESSSLNSFVSLPSTDTTPVSITLGHSTRLRIPRNYLFDAAFINPYPDIRLTMMTTYPGFQGVDLTTIDKAKTQQWYDADNIVIIRRVAGMSVGLVKLNKQRQLDQIAKEIGPLDKNPQTRPGFRTYFVKYRGSAENSLVISCPKPGGQLTNTDFCQVEAAVAPDFVVTYQFRPPLLPHWQEIDDGVMNVLNSFVEK